MPTGKSDVMVLGRKEGLEFEVYIDGIHLEHVSEIFKYVFWTNQVQMRQSVGGGSKCY